MLVVLQVLVVVLARVIVAMVVVAATAVPAAVVPEVAGLPIVDEEEVLSEAAAAGEGDPPAVGVARAIARMRTHAR